MEKHKFIKNAFTEMIHSHSKYMKLGLLHVKLNLFIIIQQRFIEHSLWVEIVPNTKEKIVKTNIK